MRKFSIFNFQFLISNERGFTLIELLIVIAIIGVLTTLTSINYVNTKQRARDTQRKSDFAYMQAALELYKADQHSYPTSVPACGGPFKDPTGTTTYLAKIPCDPTNSGQYIYKYTSNGSTYTLTTCLENVNDPKKDATNDSSICTGGTTNWSYKVMNP